MFNLTIFSYNLDYALGWMVIHSLWEATLIAIISGILMLFLRKKAAKVRYVVANLALLTVVVAAVVTFCIYYDFANESAKTSFTPIVENADLQLAQIGQTEIQNPNSEIAAPLTQSVMAQNALISMEAFKGYFNHNIPLIVTVWLLGVMLFMLKLLGGMSYIYFLKSRMNFTADEFWTDMLKRLAEKAGLNKTIEIVESAMVRTPMVVGHLKPLILFPMGVINRLTPEEVEAILAHELSHVMRNDFIFNILQSVVEALFYFHPAVWWISSQIRNERESACDDMAIALLDSKIQYAKALIAIQEMAYFPLTPSLAFAGQRKSQLMMRMHRILNQPQNKTNVMEKLIATCSLVLLIVGLSFAETPFSNKYDTPSVIEAPETLIAPTSPSTPILPSSSNKIIGFHLILPNKMDSIPVSGEIANGIYNYEDNTQDAQLTVKDSYVTNMKINGIDLKDEQLPNYKKLIDKILRTKSPQKAVEDPITAQAFKDAGISFSENGMQMNNSGGNMSVDENGLNMVILDGQGGTTRMKVDKNGSNYRLNEGKKDPYNTIRFKADNGFSYVVFTLNGENIWKCYQNDRFLGDLILKNNKILKNGRDATSNELLDYGLVYYNKSLNPKTGGFQIITLDKRGEWNTDVRENSNGYTYSYQNYDNGGKSNPTMRQKDFGGSQDVQSFRKSLKNRQKALNDKAIALKRKGIDIIPQVNPTMNEVGRILSKDNPIWDDLQDAERKLDCIEMFIENKDRDDEKEELEESIKDLQNDVKDLRKEIKECNCTTNFDFRMSLIANIDKNITPNLKDNMSRSALNDLELKFMKIKNDWEKGVCDENSNVQNYIPSVKSANLDARVKNIARKAESLSNAIDDCDCGKKDPNWVNWAKIRLNAEYALALNNKNDYRLKSIENEIAIIEKQFNRLKNQKGNTNCEGCPSGNGQEHYSYSVSPNGNSYGTGSSQAEARAAQKDAENKAKESRKSRDDSREAKAQRSIYLNLNNLGLITLGKKCTFEITDNYLRVNGKKIDENIHQNIINEFEKILGKKVRKMSLSFTGIITNASDEGLDMNGSLHTSLDTD